MRTHRIEVGVRAGVRDAAGESVRARLAEDLGLHVGEVRVADVYTVCATLSKPELERLRRELFTDPVVQCSTLDAPLLDDYDFLAEVGFRPGVTDNIGRSAAQGIEDVLGRPLGADEPVFKSTQYAFRGGVDQAACERAVRGVLANELIEQWAVWPRAARRNGHANAHLPLPIVTDRSDPKVHTIDLEISDAALMQLSRDGMLALELDEMQAIRDYYRRIKSARRQRRLPEHPTDIEIEILAQTWSEHCKHKIFNAEIEYTNEHGDSETIHSLFKTYIKRVTDEVVEQRHIDWLVSLFHDNAGIIRFDDNWNFALKAETHNSPSALDPYGGAMTGIVGVNRDIIGAGMGCRCIFNTDVFCFAPPDYAGEIPERLLHPRRVLRGVHRGVKDGGNQSGIPTVNGAIVFHDRFLGKPLVFCGTGGLIPRTINGKPSEEKGARPGDLIVMAGGRIGKDGIHGATFSSEELHEGSPATAVQIGDPITQKKLAEFLIEARDAGLYSSITDNGAGGLSSSVGEMARTPGGAEVHLDRAPLKYAGLAPWEIFLSEAQERMTLSVPQDRFESLQQLAARHEVEVTSLGTFTKSGLLECFFDGECIASLDMDFLHDGLPPMKLKAVYTPLRLDARSVRAERGADRNLSKRVLDVLAAHNVCSKESFVRMYDHEVQASSVLKPFQGVQEDGPGDAAVIRPVPGTNRGLAIACGICPKYSELDTYWMMMAAVDEAVRNLVCVGAKLGTIAGLDNFCWPDPVQSEKTPDGEHKLGQLVRACKGLYDACHAYGIPLISGKDSMKNDYKIGDTKISIPPTVLFTAVGIVEDVRRCVSMDAKRAGDVVYVLGDTRDELGGSEYFAVLGESGGDVPKTDPASFSDTYRRIGAAMDAGLIASCHDCSDGGLAVALAETAMAGALGMTVDLSAIVGIDDEAALFSESQGRFVITVSPESTGDFERLLAGTPCYRVGTTSGDGAFTITRNGTQLVNHANAELKNAWQRPLKW